MTAAAVLLAAGLDALLAEPPSRVHPVALFGRLVSPVDRGWTRPRLAGVAAAALFPLLAGGVAFGAVHLAAGVEPVAGAVLTGVVLFSTSSLRMLLAAARRTVRETESDLDAARESLPALAGRDADALSAGQVRSAAVESLAENLADGFVAPLGAFTLAGAAAGVLAPDPGAPGLVLASAAAAAAWVKAVNTLDSMLGYRSKPVGWAPARLDDLVMWVPARATALLVALAAGRPAALVAARSDARAPPSPNSGWPMATLARVLGVRLEKPGVYVLAGGDGHPTAADATRALGVTAFAGIAAVAVSVGVLLEVAL
ncbi:cobalamin biosynthesis protein CobD [Halorarum salinum]|uniref:Probable cobalamin biosynthesis protein CobD n=1 Tax=Halorarum salinum TaxID=2743089 RepID=A0A7D5QJM5_9EURY|nr:cobalamin biosynthesis protein CobD [Halobaculum salinum]